MTAAERLRAAADVAWRWAYPPDAELETVVADFTAGRLPDDAELIKESLSRKVWRAPRSAGGLILKHFKVSGWEGRRSALWPSRAGREYAIMTEFCRSGLPTVRPVACGERRVGRRVTEAWFLSTLVPDATTVAAALAEAEDAGDRLRRNQLMTSAMAVVAELHRHPYNHRDLHAGNLLLDGDGRVLIIDLHSVWRSRTLDLKRRMQNLAALVFSLRPYFDIDDPTGLLQAYAQASDDDAIDLAGPLRAAVLAFERDFVRGRTARCLRKSSEFAHGPVTTPGGRGHFHHRREYGDEALLSDLAEHAAVVARGGPSLASGAPPAERNPQLLGDSARSQVTLVGAGAVARVVKTYRDSGPAAMLRNALGRGRARAAWVFGRRLEVLSIPTPRTLGLLERRDGTAALVTEHVDGVTLREHLTVTLSPEVRRGLARVLGWLVGCLSRAGLRHHDLSTKNLLVSPHGALPVGKDRRTRPPGGAPHLLLIDLDGMTTMAPHDEGGLVRMLGQLGDLPDGVTATDRLRFRRAYRAAAGKDLPPGVLRDANERVLRRQARRRALVAQRLGPD